MTERPDPVDLLLAQSRVPVAAADLADRIVAAAQQPGRVRLAASPRQPRRRARRGAWTAVIAINIVLASAVAAAIGGAGGYLPAPIATATHHLVERLRAHLPLLHRPKAHRAPAAVFRPRLSSRLPVPQVHVGATVRPLVAPAKVSPLTFHPRPVPRPRLLMRPLPRREQRMVRVQRHPPWRAAIHDVRRPPSPLWRPDPERRFGGWHVRPPPAWRDPDRRGFGWGGRPRWRAGRFGRNGPGPRGPRPRGGRRFR